MYAKYLPIYRAIAIVYIYNILYSALLFTVTTGPIYTKTSYTYKLVYIAIFIRMYLCIRNSLILTIHR